MSVVLRVMGTPAPQGSKRAYARNGRVQMVESSKAVAPWREAVVAEAKRGGEAGLMLSGPVSVQVTFFLRRPKSHYRTGRNAHLLREDAPKYPAGRPDLDKCARSTLDALTQAGLIADDALVVDLHARKRFTHPDRAPGAWIEIEELHCEEES